MPMHSTALTVLLGLLLTATAVPDGIAANRDALYEALDWSHPGLASAALLFAQGDREAGWDEVDRYFSQRSVPQAFFPVPLVDAGHAEDALDDRFHLQGVTGVQARRQDGGLDWDHRGPRNDPEWAWFVNRHIHLRLMMHEWVRGGDKRFADAINEQLSDWISRHPAPAVYSFSSQWRALETARRVEAAWLEAFFLEHDGERILSPQTRLDVLASLADHGRVLRHQHAFWGNHLVSEMTALALLALAWPEFRDAEAWLAYALGKLHLQLANQIYPDGTQKELSNHYQRIVAAHYLRVLAILEAAGRHDEASRFREPVEQMWDYIAFVMRPDGTGPLNNDSDLEDNRGALDAALRVFKRDDWDWLVSKGGRGHMPDDPPSRFYPWAGQAIMRDDWEDTGHWAFFDIGPHGRDHQHRDRLHLSLSLGNEDFLVDGGRYSYQPGPMRDYFTGGRAHNVVRLHGADSRPPPNVVRQPLPVMAVIQPKYDVFAATVEFPRQAWTGQGPSRQTRLVIYLRGQYWLVLDWIWMSGSGEVETRWKFHPDRNVTIMDHRVVAHADNGEATLQIIPASAHTGRVNILSGIEGAQPQGWYSPQFHIRMPAPTAVYSIQARVGFHLNTWLLWPGPTGDEPKVVLIDESPPGFAVVEVQHEPDRLDRFYLDLNAIARATGMRGGPIPTVSAKFSAAGLSLTLSSDPE